MKHKRFVSVLSMIGLAALILIMNLTSPTEIGPFGVLLFFLMVYVVFFGIVTFLMKTFYQIGLKREVFRRKDYLYAAIGAFGPIIFLMLFSFGVVNGWTIGLVAVMIFLTEFLVYKKV